MSKKEMPDRPGEPSSLYGDSDRPITDGPAPTDALQGKYDLGQSANNLIGESDRPLMDSPDPSDAMAGKFDFNQASTNLYGDSDRPITDGPAPSDAMAGKFDLNQAAHNLNGDSVFPIADGPDPSDALIRMDLAVGQAIDSVEQSHGQRLESPNIDQNKITTPEQVNELSDLDEIQPSRDENTGDF
jgi:hypothetical protein